MRILMLLCVLTGCSWKGKIKNLSDTEFDHYSALKVYMDGESPWSEPSRKTYLKLKTQEERDTYLKEYKLWDRFYKYEPHIQELIVSYQVQAGWTKDMVEMSWGIPYDKRKLVGRQAVRSELWVYRFEEHENGDLFIWEPNSKSAYKAIRFLEQEVIMDDDVVIDIKQKKGSW
ncbi:MAG: hypothetical protein QGG40_02520 [Myxococcota bacterium]|nr:hypothetical protein [Myxococcota bacterium]